MWDERGQYHLKRCICVIFWRSWRREAHWPQTLFFQDRQPRPVPRPLPLEDRPVPGKKFPALGQRQVQQGTVGASRLGDLGVMAAGAQPSPQPVKHFIAQEPHAMIRKLPVQSAIPLCNFNIPH